MGYTLETLLDNKNKIILDIFKIISAEDRWFGTKEISDKLSLSERSVQRQFNYLFDFINENMEEKERNFSILFKKNKGIYLKNIKGDSYTTFINKLFSSDENVKILKLIFLDKFPSVTKYANDNFLSINYVRRSVSKINQLGEPFNISYSVSSKSLEGDESQIRMLAYSFFWFVCKNQQWPEEFKIVDKNKVEAAVEQFVEKLGLRPDDLTKKELAFNFTISLLRIKKKHKVKFREEWRNYLSYGLYNNLIKGVQDMFEAFYVYDRSEVMMMALTDITHRFSYESENLRQIIIKGNLESESDVYKATILFMEGFSRHIIHIPENKYSDLFTQAFKAHLFSKVYKSIHFDYNAHCFNESLVQQYPEITKNLERLIDRFYQLTSNKIFREKEFLIQQYLIIFMDIVPSTHFEKKVRILVETDLPVLIERDIKKYLENFFIHKYNISFIDSAFIQKPDILLTNMAKEVKGVTVIGFQYPINNRILSEIENAMGKII